MANGSYPPDSANALADIIIPSGCEDLGKGHISCATGNFDLGVGWGNAFMAIIGFSRKGTSRHMSAYVSFLDYSTYAPGAAECWAAEDSSVGNKVCTSMGGILSRSFDMPFFEGGRVKAYRLP